MSRGVKNYYQILNLTSVATHEEIKHAFRQRALSIHPDHHPDLPEAEEIFRLCAEAYETLSDIHKRAAYDLRVLQIRPAAFDLGLTPNELVKATSASILDTFVDDTLEELVVGNEPPTDTSLRTLFRDLQKTENFILIRDGKEAFYTRQYRKAAVILERAHESNPKNILILYFLGCAHASLNRLAEAEKLLRRALQLGESRLPANHCPGVRKALLNVYRRRHKNLRAKWLEEENRLLYSPSRDEADETVAEVNRAMARLHAEQLARQATQPRKQLDA